jgi:hypothetical protein
MADDTQEMKIPLCTVFEQMHNLSGSTSNTCMSSSQVLAVPGDRRHGFDVRQQSFFHAFGRITGIAVTNQNKFTL